MSTLTYLSRNYTEFGPFTTAEILDFKKRGIVHDTDHLRAHGDDAWQSLDEWVANSDVQEVIEDKPKAVKKTVAAAKKAVKAPAKKAAAKKVAKAAE